MKVKGFTEKFIQPNSLVRLWNKNGSHYEQMIKTNICFMDWELITSDYQDKEVIGIASILITDNDDNYSEAINLVIEE